MAETKGTHASAHKWAGQCRGQCARGCACSCPPNNDPHARFLLSTDEKEGEVKDLPSLVEKFVRKHVKGVSEELEKLQHSLEHQLTGACATTR